MTIKAVVWDIGRVLIEWNPDALYDARIGETKRKELMSEVPLDAMNLEVDRGADLNDEVEALARAYPNWAEEIRWWRDDWLKMASPAKDASVAILKALRDKGIPCLALSNFGITTYEIAQEAYPFLEPFERRWISGHMGLIKPDPAIYAALEDESGFAPEHLLFTDDKAENIAAAAERGWHTHLFEGADGWARCLSAHGLLGAEDLA